MKTPLAFAAGLAAGVLALAAARFAFAGGEAPTHYHANFALFVDGERIDLSDDRYMEDVAACAAGATVQPRERVHLHGNDPDVVHVHHPGATWGHLLANLGFGAGDGYLALDDGRVLVAGEGRTLLWILNGRPAFAAHNTLIRPGDRLLLTFGAESEAEALAAHFPRVAANAAEFDRRDDPAGCAGGHRASFGERLRRAFAG